MDNSKKVVVVGGGVSGLSAAHELVERGFKVTVYERRKVDGNDPGDRRFTSEALGGKARSYPVALDPNTVAITSDPSTNGRIPRFRRRAHARPDPMQPYPPTTPGEHGFRFFPAFYRHLPDTMARIPSAREPRENGPRDPSENSVEKNLISPGLDWFATYRARDLIPFLSEFPGGDNIPALDKLREGTRHLGLEPRDVLFYFSRLWQVLTSCQERRFKELEITSWYDFVDAKKRSAAFQDYLGAGSTRNLVASRAQNANARIIAEISIQTWMPILFPRPWNFADKGDRILNGPTQDVWIRPWYEYLRRRGVDFQPNQKLERIRVEGGEVTGLTFRPADEWATKENLQELSIAQRRDAFRRHRLTTENAEPNLDSRQFGHLLLALPVEDVLELITPAMRELDDTFTNMESLRGDLGWMSGIQIYLKNIPPSYRSLRGHVNFVDSPWALTAILQSSSWTAKFRDQLARDGIEGVLSICVSDWRRKGFNHKMARDCNPDEVYLEVWAQIVRSLPDLEQAEVVGYALDDDLLEQVERSASLDIDLFQNAAPLLVNKTHSWQHRPSAGTRISNLLLAGDYVRTHTGLACMEGANESARAAVNEILSRAGSSEVPCQVWDLPEPAIAKAAQARDRARFVNGQQWADLPGSPMSALVEGGSALEDLVENLRRRL